MPVELKPIARKPGKAHLIRPCSPVQEMIDEYLQGKERGAKIALFESAIVAFIGAQYPRHVAAWKILSREKGR